MPTNMTEAGFGAAIKRLSSTAWIVLAEITHRQMSDTLYLTTEPNGVTSNSQAYTYFPFEVVLPGDTDAMQRAKVTFQAVDRQITDAILGLIEPPFITFKIITSLDLDVVEMEAANMLLVGITGDALTISGDLVVKRYDAEPWPMNRADKEKFPALWR